LDIEFLTNSNVIPDIFSLFGNTRLDKLHFLAKLSSFIPKIPRL